MSRFPSNNCTPTPRGRSRRKEPHMKTIWVVKGRTERGWEDFKSFTSAKNADQWLTSFILENEYSPEDFTIVVREGK